MLDFYVKNDFKRRQWLACALGEHLSGFAGWLHSAGYQRRPAQLTLRGAAHLGYWASTHSVPTERLDEPVLAAFARHLPTCACPPDFQGRGDYHVAAARRFVEYLQAMGILPQKYAVPETMAPLVQGFSDWMRRYRGITESTLTNYLPLVKEFVAALGDDAGIRMPGWSIRSSGFSWPKWKRRCAGVAWTYPARPVSGR